MAMNGKPGSNESEDEVNALDEQGDDLAAALSSGDSRAVPDSESSGDSR